GGVAATLTARAPGAMCTQVQADSTGSSSNSGSVLRIAAVFRFRRPGEFAADGMNGAVGGWWLVVGGRNAGPHQPPTLSHQLSLITRPQAPHPDQSPAPPPAPARAPAPRS